MTDREKLIELMVRDECPIFMVFGDNMEGLADFLIANGVRLEEKQATSDESKWIPLSERKPGRDELILVFFEGMRDTNCAIQVQYGWCIGGSASHWMPLPQQPKEEQT